MKWIAQFVKLSLTTAVFCGCVARAADKAPNNVVGIFYIH